MGLPAILRAKLSAEADPAKLVGHQRGCSGPGKYVEHDITRSAAGFNTLQSQRFGKGGKVRASENQIACPKPNTNSAL